MVTRASQPAGPGVVDALGLLWLYADEVVVRTARDTQMAVARRVFGMFGRPATIPRLVHDGIAETVYAGVAIGFAAAGMALRGAGRAGLGPRLEASASGRFLRSALAGVVGDRIRDDRHVLHFDMAVRRHGRDVPPDRDSLAAAFPEATDSIVVFVHGLCETEDFWRRGPSPTYAETVAGLGWTPVLLRVNTGLGVRENGAALASLLQRLCDAWPTEVRRITFVGHSVGGLVVRAACAVTTPAPAPWTDRVTDVVFLGTPHLGARLARQTRTGGSLLKALPEAAAFGRILDHRSGGISDLEEGLLHDVAALTHARVRLVSASLPDPLGQVFGDLFVHTASATGRSADGPELFPHAETVHLPGTHHFGLLNHPEVHRKLAAWLA